MKTNGVYTYKLEPLNNTFWHGTELSGYRIGINFDKISLEKKKKNYLTKIVNVYIVYDLDVWPKYLTNNFNFKNCLFGTIYIVKNIDKEKYLILTMARMSF